MKDTNAWTFKESYFSWEELYEKLVAVSTEKNWIQTQKALVYMKDCHAGQYRNKTWYSDARIPYIVHPLTMAWQMVSLGFDSDEMCAAILLHDVCEDCGVLVTDLPFSQQVKGLISLLTFEMPEGCSKDEAKNMYFKKISQSCEASIIKIIDRCNNISTMTSSFKKKRMMSYITETETYIYPLIQKVKTQQKLYEKQMFLLEYHMVSVMETIKNMLCRSD